MKAVSTETKDIRMEASGEGKINMREVHKQEGVKRDGAITGKEDELCRVYFMKTRVLLKLELR